jgi:Fe-S-cluster-containing dehydrogenase component
MRSLIIEKEKCTGCRSCELACSYHHSRLFNPRKASIFIEKIEKYGIINIYPYSKLPKNEIKKRFACDRCKGEDEYQCVKYCNFGAIRLE